MNKNCYLLLFLVIFAVLAGCSQRATESQSGVNPAMPTRSYTEAELDKLVTVGMTFAEVTNIFGLPGSVSKVDDNVVLLNYMFRFDENRSGMSGFGIDVKNNRVVRWTPIIQGEGYAKQGGVPQGALGEHSFALYLVIGGLTNYVGADDSQENKNATDFKVEPDASFKAKVFAGNSVKIAGEYDVILVIGEDDVSKLSKLIETNIGKRLFVVWHNKIIAAPLISSRLISRQFEFTVKDAKVLIAFVGK